MLKRFLTLFLAVLMSVLLSVGVFAATKRNVMTCDWCGKKIASNASFLRSEDKNFCSEKCFNQYAESQLPVCSVCERHFQEGFTSNGKDFCSRACLETTFRECAYCHRREPSGVLLGEKTFLCDYCRSLPACSSCQMPLDKFAKDLGDGRKICSACERIAVSSQFEAEKLMAALRQTLADRFKMSTDHTIQFVLCNRNELKKESCGDGERELGLFVVNRHTVTLFGRPVRDSSDYRILILNGQPPDNFRTVGAHELAHDWMEANLPHIEEPMIREGFAEFVSWAFAKSENMDRIPWNIEQNTDEVYGEGFRKVRKMMGDARTAAKWKQILLKAYPAPAANKK